MEGNARNKREIVRGNRKIMGLKVTIQSIEDPNIHSFCEEKTLKTKDSLWIIWLGQAGFYVRYRNNFLMIDPYLTDSLAHKYKGKEFPHVRMMPIPFYPYEVHYLDFIFCTHGHSDHMDPGTLALLAKDYPERKFIVPRAEEIKAMERGVPQNQLILVNDGDSIKLSDDIKLDVIPSAHEGLDKNNNSEYYYLGYILTIGPYKLYHSGDCVPYPGLTEKLKSFEVDVALLPVNGRDKYREERGIPGNFTFDEAVELCKNSKIQNLIVHHFGMFSFNTVDISLLEQKIKKIGYKGLDIIIPSQLKIMISQNDNSIKY
jgi:L-ascorbate metabolism protein UlaG (beta-lactamase superfamily)